MNGQRETVKITETYVRSGDKTYMESSLRHGKWEEVTVVWLDQVLGLEPKVKWLAQERLVTKEEHRLLSA